MVVVGSWYELHIIKCFVSVRGRLYVFTIIVYVWMVRDPRHHSCTRSGAYTHRMYMVIHVVGELMYHVSTCYRVLVHYADIARDIGGVCY